MKKSVGIKDLIGKASFIGYQGATPEESRPLTNFFRSIRENTWDKLDFEAARQSFIPAVSAAVVGTTLIYGAYVFGDGVGRPEQPTTAEITGARYSPPYTTQSCSRDSNGNQSCHTVRHPEEFHIRIQIPQSSNSKDISVSKREYRELKQASDQGGVYYQAVYRDGRWSHRATWIDLAPGPRLASRGQIEASRRRPVQDPSEIEASGSKVSAKPSQGW